MGSKQGGNFLSGWVEFNNFATYSAIMMNNDIQRVLL